MGPDRPLPIQPEFDDPHVYVDTLLKFVTSNALLTKLVGGIHVLDFFTRDPSTYEDIFPQSWRDFFDGHDIMDILDLLMREDVDQIGSDWRGGLAPPEDLLSYIKDVRRLLLIRDFGQGSSEPPAMARDVGSGMSQKKSHEVAYFSQYIHRLCESIPEHPMTHLIDLGSGQGYLPRALASDPYHHKIIGVESRQNNIEGSKNYDILAKLAPKPVVLRDKKAFRQARESPGTPQKETKPVVCDQPGERGYFHDPGLPDTLTNPEDEQIHVSTMGKGSVQYISHYLLDGDLSRVVRQIVSPSALAQRHDHSTPLTGAQTAALPRAGPDTINAMVIALHSCGNLVHHGLRSLLQTPQVKAVAMVGCCYNLLTERLGPPTHKLHNLRAPNARLASLARAHDPHGFPMSARYCAHADPATAERGVRLNITARMLAVQAPQNWGRADSAAFFTRHFYRALLQRVFVDLRLIAPPPGSRHEPRRDGEDADAALPVILGSLPKRAYVSFAAYVRAAAAKLASRHGGGMPREEGNGSRGARFAAALEGLGEGVVEGYEARYAGRRHALAVTWSLMAFSAGVVEAAVVADRWCWLGEQDGVRAAWVESVFGFGLSPRNLVVVGVKG